MEGYWNAVVTGVDSEISGSLVSIHSWYKKIPLREIITSSIHEVKKYLDIKIYNIKLIY